MVQFFVRQYKHKHLHLKINQKFVSIEERVLFSFVKGLINNPLSLFFKKVLDWKVYTRDFQYRLKFCDKCSHSIMSYKFLLLFCEVVNKYRSHISCHMSSKKICLQNYFICRSRKKRNYILCYQLLVFFCKWYANHGIALVYII